MLVVRLVFVLFLFTSFEKLFAQSNSLVGTVSNSSKTLISFAGVSLKATSGQFEKTIETDSSGAFSFRNLDKGQYSIAVTHIGYLTYKATFFLNQDTAFNVQLQQTDNRLNEVVVSGNRA